MSPAPGPPRNSGQVDWSWIRGGFAGVVAQGIIDLCVVVYLFSVGGGVLEDPFFGAYWWNEYQPWILLIALALVAGSAICLFWHWILSFLLACAGAALFIAYYEADCTEFDRCNLLAFLGWGFTIAFAAPCLVAIGLATMRRLITKNP